MAKELPEKSTGCQPRTEIFGFERLTSGSANAPVPYFGSEWRKLPATAGQETISLETLITAGPKLKGKRQII